MTEGKKQAPALDKDIRAEVDNAPSVSAQMRLLCSKGYSRADVARILGKRYQHVKNVMDAPLKKKTE